jgi:hypothetical protein
MAKTGLLSSDNKKDTELTGASSLVDFLLQKLRPDLFPTAAKTLIETAQGNKEPITEKNFTPEELKILQKLIESTNEKGNVQYPDYYQLMKKQQKEKGTIPASFMPSITSMLDPIGNIQTTLGRFTYSRDADGNLIIVDKYDFNKPSNLGGMYGLLRNYAGEKIPTGSGRDVKINLGKVPVAEPQSVQFKDPFKDTTR